MPVLFNGHLMADDAPCVPVFDRGLTLGHGLFETMLACQGRIPLLPLHWQRLTDSAALLGMRIPLDLAQLSSHIQTLLQANAWMQENCALRLTVTDGAAQRGLLADGTQTPNVMLSGTVLPAHRPASMTATVVATRRNEWSLSSRVKSLSYLDNILAKREAIARGFDEALMLNSRGVLADGALSSVFVVREGKVCTPPVSDGALPGVIRRLIVDEMKLACECSLDVDMLANADAMFVTNTLVGLVPLARLEARPLLLTCPLTKEIAGRLAVIMS